MYSPSSENKGADQLRGYCEADLRLCFRLGRFLVFPCGGSYVTKYFGDILASNFVKILQKNMGCSAFVCICKDLINAVELECHVISECPIYEHLPNTLFANARNLLQKSMPQVTDQARIQRGDRGSGPPPPGI